MPLRAGRGVKAMIEKASINDLEEILALQKLAYQSEAELCRDYHIAPLTQTLEGMKEDFNQQTIYKLCQGGKIIGSVRAYKKDGVCHIGRVIVHPDCQNQGHGKALMGHVEKEFGQCKKYSLFTAKQSPRNMHFYQKLGYQAVREETAGDKFDLVYFEKVNF